MSSWRSAIGIVLSSAALGGCSGRSLDVGSNDGGASGVQGVLALGPSPDASGVRNQVWTGHLVDQQFPDGSNALTLTLDFASGGQVTGTLLLGDGALLQPPTDPNVGYPPGNQGEVTLVEGFPYTILNGTFSGSHLSFQISEYEVWTRWCALQTPLVLQVDSAGHPNAYGCAPEIGSVSGPGGPTGCQVVNQADGGPTPIDCGKLILCGLFPGMGVCVCTATRCVAMSPGGPSIDLDIAGTMANGTISGMVDYQVQFIRSR